MVEKEDPSGFDLGKSFAYFQKIVRESGPAATASYTLLASVLIFTILGWYMDKVQATGPFWILIGIGFGLIAGFYHLAKMIWSKKQ